MDFTVVLVRSCDSVCGDVSIITETETTYIMIEFTLQFDNKGVVPGLLPLLQVVQRSLMQ